MITRQIAESLGYRAIERRPRGSLRTFYEITAPDGSVCGSASGSQSDPDRLIAEAWEDALPRLSSSLNPSNKVSAKW
jgi:hypothetical protein